MAVVAVALGLLAACTRPDFAVAPRWVDNDEGARLTGWLEAEADEPVELLLRLDDGDAARTWRLPAARRHRSLVGGLRPEIVHTLEVVPVLDGREGAPVTLTLPAQSLPEGFPPLDVTSDPARMEPGLTLLGIGPWVVLLDAEGTVRWLREFPGILHQLTTTFRGTLLLQLGRTTFVEMALSGAVLRQWSSAPGPDQIPVDVPALHHDVIELASGHWLALAIERRWVPDYPSSETDPEAPPEDSWVAGDVVVELTPEGEVVRRWSLLDVLEPTRIGYNAVASDYWDFFWDSPTRDWSHGNSVWFDAARREVVVSLRNQDAVVGLGYDDQALHWVLAPPANWPARLERFLLRPARPDLLVPYHQHSASVAPGGELVLFDNGNFRASPFDPRLPAAENASRGAVLALDHEAGTWDLVFDDLDTELGPVFSGSLGDADLLPRTGNLLVTYGNVGNPGYPGAIVVEVAPPGSSKAGSPEAEPPENVFELRLPAPLNTYRSERVKEVWPGL